MAVFTKYWPNGDTLTLDTSVGGISVTSDQNLTGSDREMLIQLRTTNQGEKATGSFTVKQAKKSLPSYIITTSGTRIDFDLDNTPLSNLSTTGGSTSSITVNGQSVVKNSIKEIYFGSSYNGVTSIGVFFLCYFSSLTSVNLSGLSNVTSIGHNCIALCSGLTSVDLSPLSNVLSIGDYFLFSCSSLATLRMGAETPPTLGSYALGGTNNLSLILVPCGSESAYKSATNWIAMADIIQGDCPPSYLILTNDTRIDFDLDNTPLSNLSTPYDATSSITVNGQSVVKNTIKEIYFGDSYKDVTNIGDFFLSGCSSLTSVDFSGLSNVTSIGSYFLIGCESLTSLDLSPLSNVTSIGSHFLIGCESLTSLDLSPLSNVTSIGSYLLSYCSGLATLIMGAITPPTLGASAFTDANNLSLILVPCGSESAYKSATNWIAKASIIEGDC